MGAEAPDGFCEPVACEKRGVCRRESRDNLSQLEHGTSQMKKIALFVLAIVLFASVPAWAQEFAWQKPHAKVLSRGDLEYAPEPYRFEPVGEVRYIAFAGGNDGNPGTRAAPWKHHPWDPEATARARTGEADTYVFKSGVTYRGMLRVPRDADAVLARDPSWGAGEASIYSSEVVSGWERGAHPRMPQGERVWKAEVDFLPRCAWMIDQDGNVTRLKLARTPNWTVTDPQDVMSEWWEWEQPEWWLQFSNRSKNVIEVGEKTFNLGVDSQHLPAIGEDCVGGYVWTEFGCPTGGTPVPMKIHAYDAERKGVAIGTRWNEKAGNFLLRGHRYFLENLPQYLDEPGEFWFERNGDGGTLYARLPNDIAPDTVTVEAGRHLSAINATKSVSIERLQVSGLTFRFSNVNWNYDAPSYVEGDQYTGVICVKANAKAIQVDHCRFEHVNCAVRVEARPFVRSGRPAPEAYRHHVVEHVEITDNQIFYTDHEGVQVRPGHGTSKEPPRARIVAVDFLRNKMEHANLRSQRGSWSGGARLEMAERVHAAGNFLYRIGSTGLYVTLAKGHGWLGETPFARGLVHHNKVVEAMLTNADCGNFQFNNNGPGYLWSNVSGNPGGYHHWKYNPDKKEGTPRFGMGFYFDGNVMKRHLFNNIAWGANNEPGSKYANHSAVQQFCSMNTEVFNNTFYRFVQTLRRQNTQGARSKYIGNLIVDASEYAIHDNKDAGKKDANAPHDSKEGDGLDYATLAYKGNVFHGLGGAVGLFERDGEVHETLEQFNDALRRRKTWAMDAGVVVDKDPIPNAGELDFRPVPALQKQPCYKVFVPWSLHGVVGEWTFAVNNEDHTRVIDEHSYLTPYHRARKQYYKRPYYPLRAVGVQRDDFVDGTLETWTRGALRLNGESQYLTIDQAKLAEKLSFEEGGRTLVVEAREKRTVNIDESNFMIETYLKIDKDSGVLVQKMDTQAGYSLSVRDNGILKFETRTGGGRMAVRLSSKPVADGGWHHIVAEVDRNATDGLHLYIDGKPADGKLTGSVTSASLYNEGDFLVAGGPGLDHLRCTLDFLRIARGALTDAHTTIEELYAWELDGPFLDDFSGRRRNFPESASGAIILTE